MEKKKKEAKRGGGGGRGEGEEQISWRKIDYDFVIKTIQESVN